MFKYVCLIKSGTMIHDENNKQAHTCVSQQKGFQRKALELKARHFIREHSVIDYLAES